MRSEAVRGYDTLFVQRVKSLKHEPRALRVFVKACLRNPQPITTLAAWFGVSRSTVYNWMTGQTVPHSRHLAEMTRAAELIGSAGMTGHGTPKRK
jgi:hypothetical protein